MLKIGLLVAIETDSVFSHYGNVEKLVCPEGYDLYLHKKEECDLYILHCGMGEVAAAAGAQYLISACGVSAIVNFGVVGGLTDEMSKQKICIVDRVVHYKYDVSEFMNAAVGQVPPHDSVYLYTDRSMLESALSMMPELKPVTCASGDKFVGSETEKRSISENFDADICDMEAAGIILTCEINRIPCLMMKAVSDGLAGGAGEFYEELQSASLACLKVADRIIECLS